MNELEKTKRKLLDKIKKIKTGEMNHFSTELKLYITAAIDKIENEYSNYKITIPETNVLMDKLENELEIVFGNSDIDINLLSKMIGSSEKYKEMLSEDLSYLQTKHPSVKFYVEPNPINFDEYDSVEVAKVKDKLTKLGIISENEDFPEIAENPSETTEEEETDEDREHREWYDNLVKVNKARPLEKLISVSYDPEDDRFHKRRERELSRKGYVKTYQGATGSTWELTE